MASEWVHQNNVGGSHRITPEKEGNFVLEGKAVLAATIV